MLRRIALGQLARGEQPRIAAEMFLRVLPTLRDAMVASHLLGRELSIELSPQQAEPTLALSVFDHTLAVLGRQQGVDLRRLQRTYETQALRILNGVSVKTERELRDEFIRIIEDGAPPPEAKRRLSEKFDSMGLTERSDHQVEAIFRTQSQIAHGAGRWEADQDSAVQEILWGYEYSAVMDDRTRPEHAALNGTKLPKDDAFWTKFWPPNGWNCRCVAIPVFEEETPVAAPFDVQPDVGFAFNPGEVFGARR